MLAAVFGTDFCAGAELPLTSASFIRTGFEFTADIVIITAYTTAIIGTILFGTAEIAVAATAFTCAGLAVTAMLPQAVAFADRRVACVAVGAGFGTGIAAILPCSANAFAGIIWFCVCAFLRCAAILPFAANAFACIIWFYVCTIQRCAAILPCSTNALAGFIRFCGGTFCILIGAARGFIVAVTTRREQ